MQLLCSWWIMSAAEEADLIDVSRHGNSSGITWNHYHGHPLNVVSFSVIVELLVINYCIEYLPLTKKEFFKSLFSAKIRVHEKKPWYLLMVYLFLQKSLTITVFCSKFGICAREQQPHILTAQSVRLRNQQHVDCWVHMLSESSWSRGQAYFPQCWKCPLRHHKCSSVGRKVF